MCKHMTYELQIHSYVCTYVLDTGLFGGDLNLAIRQISIGPPNLNNAI